MARELESIKFCTLCFNIQHLSVKWLRESIIYAHHTFDCDFEVEDLGLVVVTSKSWCSEALIGAP